MVSNLAAANILLESTIIRFRELRTDAEFLLIYEEASNLSEENNISIPTSTSERSSRRTKKVPKKFEHHFITERINLQDEYLTEDKRFRTDIFFPSIDLILTELAKRF